MIPIPSWATTIGATFFIGLGVGAIVKHASKLLIALAFLLIVLVAVGYAEISQVQLLLQLFITELKSASTDLSLFVPISGAFFAVGFGIGIWKG